MYVSTAISAAVGFDILVCLDIVMAAARPLSPQLFWVYARTVDRYMVDTADRTGEISPANIYTKHVRGEVLRACKWPDDGDLSVDCDVQLWTKRFAGRLGMGGKVVGLVLCKPSAATTVMTAVSKQQREVRDFWNCTTFSSCF